MSERDGGPAFPHQAGHDWATCPRCAGEHTRVGMSLRDYFAGQALSGWYTNSGGLPHTDHLPSYAEHFYQIADAMIAEREKENNK